MKVKKYSVRKDVTSCNFCNKGELSESKMSLVYPYENVVVFGRENGNGLVASICEECLDELHKKGKEQFKIN